MMSDIGHIVIGPFIQDGIYYVVLKTATEIRLMQAGPENQDWKFIDLEQVSIWATQASESGNVRLDLGLQINTGNTSYTVQPPPLNQDDEDAHL